MSNFIVRVELHGATATDYQTLHQAMEQQGFSRYIRADNGAVYHLPTAEYVIISAQTAAQVLERAQAAAATTRRAAGIIVAKYDGAIWSGLPEAQGVRV